MLSAEDSAASDGMTSKQLLYLESCAPDPHVQGPQYLLTEHILGSIPLWDPKTGGKVRRAREKHVVREVLRNGEVRRMSLVIYASGDLGLPNSVDLEFFRGFERWALEQIKIHSTLDDVVKISGAELLLASGKLSSGVSYEEMDRFFMRMAGTMIAAGRNPTSTASKVKRESKSQKSIVFHIFETVVLPGQVNAIGELADRYEVRLSSWYRRSLLMGNCFVIDLNLFGQLTGSITKVMHALLHHLFYLGKGTASQRYSELTRNWQLTRHSAISLVKQQLDRAHKELGAKDFLRDWEYRPIKTDEGKDYEIVWQAGRLWWETERALEQVKGHYELGDGSAHEQPFEPFLIEDAPVLTLTSEEKDMADKRVLECVLEFTGKRNDEAFVNWWKRAIRTLNHAKIYARIGEVRERLARSERIANPGGYLIRLVKLDAKHQKVDWIGD